MIGSALAMVALARRSAGTVTFLSSMRLMPCLICRARRPRFSLNRLCKDTFLPRRCIWELTNTMTKMISFLEGGYNLDHLGTCAAAYLKGYLLNGPLPHDLWGYSDLVELVLVDYCKNRSGQITGRYHHQVEGFCLLLSAGHVYPSQLVADEYFLA